MLSSRRDNYNSFPFGSRGSFFSDFFERDPFDDPFFKQPCGSLFSSSEDFFDPFRGSEGHVQNSKQNFPKGPVIEELFGNHDDKNVPRSGHEPIIEDPDDVDMPYNKDKKGKKAYAGEINSAPGTFCQSYSYSSVSYGGCDGTYYKSSKTRRTGADGLIEEEHEEKDSRTGEETNRLLRGLGNKGHSVSRKRDATGTESYTEKLHNLTEEEKNEFDETWKKKAEQYLPGWSKRNGKLLGHERQRPKAITSGKEASSSKESALKWPWAKRA